MRSLQGLADGTIEWLGVLDAKIAKSAKTDELIFAYYECQQSVEAGQREIELWKLNDRHPDEEEKRLQEYRDLQLAKRTKDTASQD